MGGCKEVPKLQGLNLQLLIYKEHNLITYKKSIV
jgi:hypothetical protein